MQTGAGFKVNRKALLLGASYVLFHFAYEFMPVFPVALFAGINESIFQHLKMGFFMYLFMGMLE